MIRDYLRSLVEANGFDSIVELSRFIQCEPSIVGRWLSGQAEPSIDNLRRIAAAIGAPLIELMLAAGLVTEDELGGDIQPSRPLPQEIRLVLADLERDDLTNREKRILLKGVGQARRYFWEIIEAPREPAARQRVRV